MDPFFPDYLELATAVVVSHRVHKLLPVHQYIVLLFFYILVLQEYWVLTESRVLLKPVLGGVRVFALSISSHKQTQ